LTDDFESKTLFTLDFSSATLLVSMKAFPPTLLILVNELIASLIAAMAAM